MTRQSYVGVSTISTTISSQELNQARRTGYAHICHPLMFLNPKAAPLKETNIRGKMLLSKFIENMPLL